MAPGAYVGRGLDRLAFGNGKVQVADHVLGLDVPPVRDELPVELSGVVPAGGDARGAVRDGKGGALILMGRVDLEAQDIAPVIHLVGTVLAAIALRELLHAEAAALARGQDGDLDLAAVAGVLALGDIPVHAVEAAVEVEGARLHDGERAVVVQGRVDVDLGDRVLAGKRRAGRDDERKGEGRRKERPERHDQVACAKASADVHRCLHLR